jgi:hypothetical protein
MFRNYTSSVPVHQSISWIEQKLAAFGVTDVLKNYDAETKLPCALKFMLQINGQKIPIRLPAKTAECEMVLRQQIKRPRDGTLQRIHEQAARAAWKLAADWLDIQLSMVALKQKDVLEVFLADVWDENKQQTYFDRLRETKFKALLPERVA